MGRYIKGDWDYPMSPALCQGRTRYIVRTQQQQYMAMCSHMFMSWGFEVIGAMVSVLQQSQSQPNSLLILVQVSDVQVLYGLVRLSTNTLLLRYSYTILYPELIRQQLKPYSFLCILLYPLYYCYDRKLPRRT